MRRMTLDNIFGFTDERVLETIRPLPRRLKMPWWSLGLVALAIILVVVRAQGFLERWGRVEWLALFAAAGGLIIFATKLEEWLFSALRFAALGLRLLVAATVVLAGFSGTVFFVVQGSVLDGASLRLVFLPLVFMSWLSSWAFGSVVILVIELITRAFDIDFRRRIVFAVLFLLMLAFLLCGYVTVRAVAVLEAIGANVPAADIPKFFGYSLVELPLASQLTNQPTRFVLITFLAAVIATLPAVLSACAKLGENVAERITPLMKAVDRIAMGDWSVHLEEAGGQEFLSLALSFNEMVDKLYLSRRIERAFGQYVSKQVVDRIRAQRGAVRLPAELRQASVFFADIRGFTPISEQLPPELVVNLLNRYLEKTVPLVEEYHGFLNKFVGDAVVVVFNGPLDQPDHAERAARCAIALQELITQLNAENYFAEVGQLGIGIGVATGPMLCGNIGTQSRLEYTVIGDTVNLASRLTGHAKAGEVWVSQATAELLPPTFPAVESVPLKLKGKDNAVIPYCVWPPTTPSELAQRGRS